LFYTLTSALLEKTHPHTKICKKRNKKDGALMGERALVAEGATLVVLPVAAWPGILAKRQKNKPQGGLNGGCFWPTKKVYLRKQEKKYIHKSIAKCPRIQSLDIIRGVLKKMAFPTQTRGTASSCMPPAGSSANEYPK